MSGFTVKVTREDDLWVAVATAADGTRVGALDFVDFDDIHDTMPAYIADMTDLDPEDVAVDWQYEVNGLDVTVEICHLHAAAELQRNAQEKAEQARVEAEQARTDAMVAMMSAGLSQRSIAGVVRLSPQRVNQLVKEKGGVRRLIAGNGRRSSTHKSQRKAS